MENPSLHQFINQTIDALRRRDLAQSRKILGDALYYYFDNKFLLGFMKYIAFWQEREKTAQALKNDFQRCDVYLEQWSSFLDFCKTINFNDDQALYGIRQHVFGSALACLSSYDNEEGHKNFEVLFRAGLCLKSLGNYEAALQYLGKANQLKNDSPQIMAELADVYALLDETEYAKVLFREAFTLGAKNIQLEFLESALIRKLISLVQDEGYNYEELPEWIPVYGYVFRIFNVKRELKSVEYGKFMHKVYQIEREILEGTGNKKLLVPRLLNIYFWLIDYYLKINMEQRKVNDLLLKIKGFSPKIYQLYTS